MHESIVGLPHIRILANGTYEFRKRFPRSRGRDGLSSGLTGEFKRRFRAKDVGEVAREYARIMLEYDCRISGQTIPADSQVPVVHDAPILPKTPSETCPSLAECAELYLNDKLHKGRNVAGVHALNRVRLLMEQAIGKPFEKVTLQQLTRQHAKDTRDYMLRMRKRDGSCVSPASVQRWMNILTAMITYALNEFDVNDTCRNPFRGLPMNVSSGVGRIDKRDTLPDEIVDRMRYKLTGDLALIWRVLAGTGCRLGEVTGLRIEDIILEGKYPHLSIEGHLGRRLKTTSSARLVPLVGDALDAARESVSLPGRSGPAFPSYGRYRGSDAASAILMKHLREITNDKKHVVHSLRHRMKDKLRLAGITKDIQDVILGHACSSVGEGYGSISARLTMTYRAMSIVFE